MATDAAGEEFITIVPVGESRPSIARDPSFVTVLTVGSANGAAEVVVCRPRGARLGLGLKFEGGSAAAEKVRRLLVQSCAEDSPAANTNTPWGKLIPGDEILAIDNTSVSDLTRIECVRRLKDSDETLKLLVRHFESIDEADKNVNMIQSDPNTKQMSEIVRPTALPPPVPPRKLGKKNSFKEKQTMLIGDQHFITSDGIVIDKESIINGHNGFTNGTNKLSRKSSFDSHTFRQSKESISSLKKGSPEEVRRLVRRLSDGKTVPPEAEVYIDLLSTEWERCLALADVESDDTGSSISTVVDRFGSITSSLENSIPSTPIMQPKTIDIQKVLNSIENIDSSILNDINNTKFMEQKTEVKSEILKAADRAPNYNNINNHDYSTKQQSNNTPTLLKKTQENDKNNNNSGNGGTINSNDTEIKDSTNLNTEKASYKTEIGTEMPKPMPRSTKNDRSVAEKSRPISLPKTSSSSSSESLLTLSKKNCIETWLQRSEAEMNSTTEKTEKTQVPEVLPRLIDFVPKPQFKESTNETTHIVRPTTAPPPPPVDTREDGSGASLDTIGELDESSDVTDNSKPPSAKVSSKRKSSFERSFWEDRVNKSDVEDKSLSNDETPLPTCPRQPPDGVETPSDVVEKVPELPSRLPPKLPIGWPNTRSRYSYSSRSQDARSEASVKDKIAMFSNEQSSSSDRLEKCGTLPAKSSLTSRKSISTYSSSYNEISSLDRRLTKSQDNLDEALFVPKKRPERPEVMGALENSMLGSNYSIGSNNKTFHIESKPLFYGSTNTISSTMETFIQPVYHARSISDDSGTKSNHKSNLEYLIEQRKKSMSKLRGLAIPEVQAPIVDLPEIKVQDSLSKSFLTKTSQINLKNRENKSTHIKSSNLNENKWKSNLMSNNVPKYSPAFKRKSLQVYTPSALSNDLSPVCKYTNIYDTSSKSNNKYDSPKVVKSSMEFNGSGRMAAHSQVSKLMISNRLSNNYKNLVNDVRDYKNVEIKICTATDVIDSDNDSAMSSTQSSYRSSASSPLHNLDSIESDNSRISPRITHYSFSQVKSEIPMKNKVVDKNGEQYMKRNICRSMSSDTNVSLSSSAGSAVTSGSQASCSSLESSLADTDKVKNSKSYSIDTINRRNILASAKCRSGRDDKLKSPVIEAKFAHDSDCRSPSPIKASDRLSTLTSTVSAISIKGDNRRRNKKVAESDTDSDSDSNLRQRKADFKNTRLKRNSSNSNKHKYEFPTDAIKLEDAPKTVSEKIIKDVKNTALESFDRTSTVSKIENKNNELSKHGNVTRKDENKINNEILRNQKNITDTSNFRTINPQNKIITAINSKTSSELTKVKSENNSFAKNYPGSQIIRLKRGAGTGVGLILAGGIDCEAKDVTVHRVLEDSIAAKAGLKRGVKVISINGCSVNGLTHAQSVAILKEQRLEVVIEIENETQSKANGIGCGSDNAESKVRQVEEKANTKNTAGSVVTVCLDKAGGGAGLGFGLDGGRDSPHGDRPLTIKKLFAGGAAAQCGRILVGAELLSAGGQSVEGFTRTQAWAALKALPVGPVTLVLRNP